MKNKLNVCDFFCIVAVLCHLNGSVYEGGSIVAQLFQGILIVMSMYYWYIANTQYKLPALMKGLNVLLFLFTIYGVAVIIENPPWARFGTQTYLKNIYKSLLPIYSFYVFAKQDKLTLRRIKFWYFLFLLLEIRAYYVEDARLSQIIENSGTEYTSLTNNSSYHFIALLPGLVLFKKKPVLQYLLMTICGYYIISGMKRGAILCGAVCIVWFIISYFKSASNRQRWIILMVTMAVIIVGVYYVDYMMETSNFFRHRVEQTKEGDASNRDYIYGTLWEHFLNEEDFGKMLWGNGVYSTLRFIGTPAHNDWLEILMGQGVLGVLVYLIYWICFYITWRRHRRDADSFMIIGMTLICYGLSSCFSMSYSSIMRCAAMTLGYALAVGCVGDVLQKNTSIEEVAVDDWPKDDVVKA